MLNEKFDELNSYFNGTKEVPPIAGVESLIPYSTGFVSLSVKKDFGLMVDIKFKKSYDTELLDSHYQQTINLATAKEYVEFFSLIVKHLEKNIGDSK